MSCVAVAPAILLPCATAILDTDEYFVENSISTAQPEIKVPPGTEIQINCSAGYRLSTSDRDNPVTSQSVTCGADGSFTAIQINKCIRKYII